MGVNRERPHILVLPEDDANRQIANGFLLNFRANQIQILQSAGGWKKVVDRFLQDHEPFMNANAELFMVLLIDFDTHLDRFEQISQKIPATLKDRVFILGAFDDPEDLKKNRMGSYEAIGEKIANDCRDGTNTIWEHPLLVHNVQEVARICQIALPKIN